MLTSAAHPGSSKAPSETRFNLGPLHIDSYPLDLLVQEVIRLAFNSGETHHIATVNAQFYVLAERDQVFKTLLGRADFVCADGSSIVAASRFLKGRRIERIAGVDLIDHLCRAGASDRLRICLVGGKPGSAAHTADLLAIKYHGLEVVGVQCPPLGFENDEAVLGSLLENVSKAKPHIVFVGLGMPKQEMFIERYIRAIGVPIAVGVGGSFEMISGRLKRAPLLVQQAGMEWAFRLLQEPSRLWKRYLIGNSLFIIYIIREKLKGLTHSVHVET